ncbi:MAG: hypothetical protein BAJALOKI1v1_1580001 [Promethearchaeota archaeon]|nr:MAG: hypothetical protein BAJALOKI1v1_1580001 [Candidatus Lokiarchaeota archaeon]
MFLNFLFFISYLGFFYLFIQYLFGILRTINVNSEGSEIFLYLINVVSLIF